MNRAECIFQLVSCVFIALSGAFHSSCCGNGPGKAHYRTRKEAHFYILEEFPLGHGKSLGLSSGPQWKLGIVSHRAVSCVMPLCATAFARREGECVLRAGEGAGECVSVCV